MGILIKTNSILKSVKRLVKLHAALWLSKPFKLLTVIYVKGISDGVDLAEVPNECRGVLIDYLPMVVWQALPPY